MNELATRPAGPLLRTLAPALARLERDLRAWIEGVHPQPLPTMTRASLEGLANDLRRQAEALDVDRPLLVIVLMGGTGVGKSTLLNALAGGVVAQASYARPTTRDPVVYYHESVKPDRLDPALRRCKLVPHDRPELEQKILVDTPDLDSNDLANRETLRQLLPAADVVLYVGSQEKYHDRLGWELFLEQRRRRAFAFILNKWDRCLHTGASGLRPDQDLLRDLRTQGFQNPLLFRTCAQAWVNTRPGQEPSAAPTEDRADRADREGSNGSATPQFPLPEEEQFTELLAWLERGLTRLEVEAIKARGVGQLLEHLREALDLARSPDLTEAAVKTRATWEKLLASEADAGALVLLNTLEPYQREIEHHFSLETQRRFRGPMATYLNAFTRARYVGSSLRDRLPFLPRVSQAVETPAAWNLAEFATACTNVAGERHLDARARALANRLLVEAGKQGFPVNWLSGPTEAAAKLDWRKRYTQLLIDSLGYVEAQWSKPTGRRRWIQGGTVWLANHLPLWSLFFSLVFLLFQYTMRSKQIALADALLPVFIVFIVLVLLHMLIAWVLPLRWAGLRGEFQRQVERRLRAELQAAYAPIPEELAEALRQERVRIDALLAQTREVAEWLDVREQAARIDSLYGQAEAPVAAS